MEFFKLPLSPIDLTKIYEEKIDLVPIDYEKSKDILGTKQSLIYISNTQFEVIFSSIDKELLKEFLTIDFKVSCPQLARVSKTCLDLTLNIDISSDTYDNKDVVDILGIDFFQSFYNENKDLLEQITYFIQQIPSYVISNSLEFIEDSNLKEQIKILDIKLVEDNSDILFGSNIVESLPIFIDFFFTILSKEDYSILNNNKVLINIMNTDPKYSGADFLGKLNELNYINLVMSLFQTENNNH